MVTIINKMETVYLYSFIIGTKLAAFALDLFIKRTLINTNAL